MTVEEAILKVKSRVLSDQEWAESLGGSFCLTLNDASGASWVFDCKAPVSVKEGELQADCRCFLDARDLLGIVSGELNPQVAYAEGRIRVEGDLFLALRFADLLGATR